MRAFLTLSLLAATIVAQAEIEVFFAPADTARGRIDARLPFVPETPQSAPLSGDAYIYSVLPNPADAPDRAGSWLGALLDTSAKPETPLVLGVDLRSFLSPALKVPEVSCRVLQRSNYGAAEVQRWDDRIPTRLVMGPGRVARSGTSGAPERAPANAPEGTAVAALGAERSGTDVGLFQGSGARAAWGVTSRDALFPVFILIPAATFVLLLGGVTLRSGRRQAEPS